MTDILVVSSTNNVTVLQNAAPDVVQVQAQGPQGTPGSAGPGTVSLPSYTFTGDTDTGMYSPGANQVAWATGGTWRISADSNGVTIPSGSLIVGTPTPVPAWTVYIVKSLTGGTDARGVYASLSAQSDVTNMAIGFSTAIGTSASSFTLNNIIHYAATAGTIGAGSTVSNQYGFNVDSSLTGATNNYGFRGQIPAGSGRWNLYMDGTANNYLAGKLGSGTTPFSNVQVYGRMAASSTSVSEFGVYGEVRASNTSGAVTKTGTYGTVVADSGYAGTGTLCGMQGVVSNSVGGLTIPSVLGVNGQANLVFGGTITNIACFRADVYNTGGATISASQGYVASDFANNNHVGFYSQVSSGTGKLGFYGQGTAQNAFIGTTTIGSLSVNGSGAKLQVSDGITFPAAQVASSDANTLDDYEEGTWTPAVAFGGGSVGITYGTQTGRYTKVGNVVHFRLHVVLTAKGSSTGTATVSLPFTASSAIGRTIAAAQVYSLASNIQYSAVIFNGNGAVTLQNTPGTTVTNITDADFTNTTAVSIAGTYEV